MGEPKWKYVKFVGWDEDKKMWLVEGEMQDPRLEIKPGYETRTKYFYEAAVHYEGKSAGFPQFHIELGGNLSGQCWLFFDPPEGTPLSVPLVERNAADVMVDSAVIIVPSKEVGPPPSECPDDIPEGTYKCVGDYSYECINGILYVSEAPDPRCTGNGAAGGCPIACVCMGTPLIDALGPIREFRDFVLKKYKLGRWFVSLYYNQLDAFLSPMLARSESLKKAGRWAVRRILNKLEK